KPLYWIYNYKRGMFYPFAPAGGKTGAGASAQQRDNERELRLKAQIGADLPLEPELERWFPLWGVPVSSGNSPAPVDSDARSTNEVSGGGRMTSDSASSSSSSGCPARRT